MKVYYLFGDFDRESKYSMHNLRRLYRSIGNKNSGYIPHCSAYGDAISDGKVLRYLKLGLKEDKDANGNFFFTALKENAGKILNLVENIPLGEDVI